MFVRPACHSKNMGTINKFMAEASDLWHVGWTYFFHLFEPSFWVALLHKYQYWMVIIGALIEGEMILILAGAAAYYGLMQVHLVILIAFLGALLHDNTLFFIGRFLGHQIFHKYPKVLKKIEKVMAYILKYNTYFILGFRFVYGIRTITPLVIGTSSIKFLRYTSLVTISAFIWATIVVYFGYSSALALEKVIENFERYRNYLGISLGVLLAALLGWLHHRHRVKKKKSNS